MKKINLVVAVLLGICSLPGLLFWSDLSLRINWSVSFVELLYILPGWLAWASLICLCLNYKELGQRSLPWPIFFFGSVATLFFFSCLIIGLGLTPIKDAWEELLIFAFGVWPSLLFIHLAAIHMREFKKKSEKMPQSKNSWLIDSV